MTDGIGLAEKMLGLPGLVVLEVEDVPGRGGGPGRVDADQGDVSVVSPASPGPRPRRGAPARPALLRPADPPGDPTSAGGAVGPRGASRRPGPRSSEGIAAAPGADRAGRGRGDPPGRPALPFGRLGGHRVRGGLGHRLGGRRAPRHPPRRRPRPGRLRARPRCRRALLPVGHAASTRPSTPRAWSIWTGAS